MTGGEKQLRLPYMGNTHYVRAMCPECDHFMAHGYVQADVQLPNPGPRECEACGATVVPEFTRDAQNLIMNMREDEPGYRSDRDGSADKDQHQQRGTKRA